MEVRGRLTFKVYLLNTCFHFFYRLVVDIPESTTVNFGKWARGLSKAYCPSPRDGYKHVRPL